MSRRKSGRQGRWLGDPRQAGGTGLDAGRQPRAPPVRRPEGRPWVERSIRWPAACCRLPWARRPRPCPSSWMAGRNTASRSASGRARSTEDAEGEVTATSDLRPTDAEIRRALAAFVGEVEQVPPAFSALKIEGKRALRSGARRPAGRPQAPPRPDRTPRAFGPAGRGSCRFRGSPAVKAPTSGPWAATWHSLWGPSDTCRRCVERPLGRFARRRPFRFPNWRPSGIFPRFSGPWPPSRPRWTTSRRWP